MRKIPNGIEKAKPVVSVEAALTQARVRASGRYLKKRFGQEPLLGDIHRLRQAVVAASDCLLSAKENLLRASSRIRAHEAFTASWEAAVDFLTGGK